MKRVLNDLEEEDDGAKGANAAYHRVSGLRGRVLPCGYGECVPVFIPATFLNGLNINMNTIPMLKICTPPPDMYSMNPCIGRDLAGEMARSHALFSFRAAYESACFEVSTAFEGLFVYRGREDWFVWCDVRYARSRVMERNRAEVAKISIWDCMHESPTRGFGSEKLDIL